MENNDYSHIPGWGIDADPKNDPTYPYRHRIERATKAPEPSDSNWERPTQQPVDIEVLKSIERPTVSAVFGTSAPPTGLSGQIRRFAFKSSESEYGHWLPLLLADRVNMVEGILDDLKHGHIPNIFAEKGLKAAWKYNRKGLLQSILIGVLVTSAAVALLSSKKSESDT
ncbi:hypothetical protein [Spirosoma validum]|uniref:Uncharacterized protein n=1 Tax=Spirosoma validum TaxID=2771355 RepID=A0A927GD08_9BACT|nr:hypothetical protein [Spirosoma validum]MBD2753070.1 hypothetical protein [Spirosoma validum]